MLMNNVCVLCVAVFRLELTVLLKNEDLFVCPEDLDRRSVDVAHVDYQSVSVTQD